jgi:hypothetical protein
MLVFTVHSSAVRLSSTTRNKSFVFRLGELPGKERHETPLCIAEVARPIRRAAYCDLMRLSQRERLEKKISSVSILPERKRDKLCLNKGTLIGAVSGALRPLYTFPGGPQ